VNTDVIMMYWINE